MFTEWIEVESSNVAAIRYDGDDEELEVQFNNNIIYAYFNVPAKVFDEFKDADSKGRYLNQHIKGVYDYQKIS